MTLARSDPPQRGSARPARYREAVFGITGAAGFIGSHLAESLLERGHRVVGVDDLSGGSLTNLKGVLGSERFSMVQGDIRNYAIATDLVRRTETVFHLAGAVGVDRIMSDPYGTLERNMGACLSLLEAARHAGARGSVRGPPRIILASTSEVYGKGNGVPFRESQDVVFGGPHRTRWAYGMSKVVGEFMALAAHHQHDVPVVVARLFNTVGPRQSERYGMVIPRMMDQALRGIPITVYGGGRQTRSFCAVQDTTRALIGLASDNRAIGDVFNVGGTEEITISYLATLIKAVARSNSPIEHIPYSQLYGPGFEDMPRRCPDTRKLRELLDWQPTVSLEEILLQIKDHQLLAASRIPPASAASRGIAVASGDSIATKN